MKQSNDMIKNLGKKKGELNPKWWTLDKDPIRGFLCLKLSIYCTYSILTKELFMNRHTSNPDQIRQLKANLHVALVSDLYDSIQRRI